MQRLEGEAHEAALAGDWVTAVQRADAAAREAEDAFKNVVNLARTVGGLSDQKIADIRGTSPSAVTQKFGARAALLREQMTTEWQKARGEWEAGAK